MTCGTLAQDQEKRALRNTIVNTHGRREGVACRAPIACALRRASARGWPRAPDSSPARPVVQAPAAPKPAIKLNVTYCFRPADKHVSLKFHYINDANKYVPKGDCEPILTEFTAMQRLDWIHLHTKERYKKGVRDVKEENPDYAYYPGYSVCLWI